MQQPFFLNNGGNKKNKERGIYMRFANENPYLSNVTAEGNTTITSIHNGKLTVETYTNITDTFISIKADKGTDIRIYNDDAITKMAIGISLTYISFENDNPPTELLDISGCSQLQELDFTNSDIAPKTVYARECNSLKHITILEETSIADLSGCTGLTQLYLGMAESLAYLDISGCVQLGIVDFSGATNLATLICNGCIFGDIDLSSNRKIQIISASNMVNLTRLETLQGYENLEQIDLSGCVRLSEVYTPKKIKSANLSGCTLLQTLYTDESTSLTTLKLDNDISLNDIKIYDCGVEQVSTAIANAITNAIATDGNIRVIDQSGQYNTIVETAATEKGWNFES